MTDYIKVIKDILQESTNLTDAEMDKITSDANIADLGMDSLDLVEAILALEKEFGIDIEISGDWMEDAVITIDGLNKIINEKLNG
jgi:acyl carrier protein